MDKDIQEAQEVIVIDPVAMNVVNRIAPGSRLSGVLEFEGGVMVQGRLEGTIKIVGGPLVLLQGGVISGTFECSEDAYLFGTIDPRSDGELSELTADGAVFLAETLDAKANITARSMKTFEGSQVEGRIRTVRKAK